jgi:hypothetical protein
MDKYTAWCTALESLINAKVSIKGELDSLEGQLNHTAYAIPLAWHFLTRIRAAKNSKSNKKSKIRLDGLLIANLVLWI